MGVGPRDIRRIRTDSLEDMGTPASTDGVLIRDVTDGIIKLADVSEIGGGVTLEEVQDNLGNTFIVAGTNLTKVYDDVANTLTLSVDAHTHTESQISDLNHLTIEEVQDNLGNSFLVGGTNLTAVYDDGANTITLNVDSHNHTESEITDLDHLTIEEVQDNLGTTFMVGGSDITLTYDDASNTLTIDSNATGVTDHGALNGLTDDDHTHYILVDGSRALTGTIGGIDPTADNHLATKAYIDTIVEADTLLLMGA